MELEGMVVEPQIILALDMALRAKLARCWVAHKYSIQSWVQCQRMMQIRFGETREYGSGKYSGMNDPREQRNELPREEWPHMFIHTLESIPNNWYTQLELQRETVSWEDLKANLINTFSPNEEDVMVDTTLQLIKE